MNKICLFALMCISTAVCAAETPANYFADGYSSCEEANKALDMTIQDLGNSVARIELNRCRPDSKTTFFQSATIFTDASNTEVTKIIEIPQNLFADGAANCAEANAKLVEAIESLSYSPSRVVVHPCRQDDYIKKTVFQSATVYKAVSSVRENY